jgi:transposase
LTTKIHTAVDGNGRPLAVMVTGGQRNDQAMLESVLDEIVVPRRRGRARSHPDAVIADRAYSSGAARRMLRVVASPLLSRRKAMRSLRGYAADAEAGDYRDLTKPATSSAISWNAPLPCSNNGVAWPPVTTNSPSSSAPL